MKPAIHRTLVFAITAFLMLLIADLVVWGAYQGMHPRDELRSQLLMHGVMHASVLVLSLIGAATAFLLLRKRLPSTKGAALFGAIFATLSFFAIVAAFASGGFVGAGAWLLLGSAAMAILSGVVARRHEGYI
jgi:hypothetical protein